MFWKYINFFSDLLEETLNVQRKMNAGPRSSAACLIPDPGVVSHTFVEIDHEIFFMAILLLPLIQEGPLSVS